jgi:hypothetical protein
MALVVIIKGFQYMNTSAVWSPVDELAHMDYIEKISTKNKFPTTGEPIEEEIFNSIFLSNGPKPGIIVNGQPSLGPFGFSYEAQHPPLYYALLSLPNKIMINAGVNVIQRVKILRIISFSFLVLGLLILLPVFKSLNQIWPFPTGNWLGDLCILFCSITFFSNKYGLGNDMLSPLLINSSILCLLLFIKNKKTRFVFFTVLFAILAVLTKYTNMIWTLIDIILVISVLIYRRQFFSKKNILSLSPILLLIIFITYKLYFTPAHGIIDNSEISKYFSMVLPAHIFSFKTFLSILYNDMLDASFIYKKIEIPVYFLIILTSITFLLLFVNIKRTSKKLPWVLLSFLILVLLYVLMFCLNQFVAGVHWYAYRHYMGYGVFWFLGFFGLIPIISMLFKPEIHK